MFSELITNRENTIIILHSLSLIFFQLRHLLSVKKLNSCKKIVFHWYRKENAELKSRIADLEAEKTARKQSAPVQILLEGGLQGGLQDSGHLPPLAPLELPLFDFSVHQAEWRMPSGACYEDLRYTVCTWFSACWTMCVWPADNPWYIRGFRHAKRRYLFFEVYFLYYLQKW